MSDQQQLSLDNNSAGGGVVSAATVSSVKTVKHSKKVTSSRKSSSTTTKTTTTTKSAGDGQPPQVSTDTSQVTKKEQQSATATAATTTTAATSAATGKVETSTTSSSSAVASASRSLVVRQSGNTFSQHMASISGGTSADQQAIDLGSVREALAGAGVGVGSGTPALRELILQVSERAEPIKLRPEDLVSSDPAGKKALLTFNVSEFESQSLEVTTDGNRISVSAKKKRVGPEGEERSEQFSRVYELPDPEPIDPERVTTSFFRDGVLTVELPVGGEGIVTLAPEGDEVSIQQQQQQ